MSLEHLGSFDFCSSEWKTTSLYELLILVFSADDLFVSLLHYFPSVVHPKTKLRVFLPVSLLPVC